MRTTPPPRTAIVLALLIVTADVTAGLGVFDALDPTPMLEPEHTLRPADTDLPGFLRDAAERTVEGGGPLLLFVDPVTREGMPGADYYGGAVPATERGAGRWRHDWDLWGQDSLQGPRTQAWRLAEGFWQLGSGFGAGASYLPGSVDELVTPVVDLRGIHRDDAVVPVHADIEPAGCGGGTADDIACFLTEEADQSLAENREVRVEAVAAALRLRHAYDFAFTASIDAGVSELNDGGRLEVSTMDPVSRQWTPWEGLEPSYDLLRVGNGELHGRLLVPDGQRGTPVVVGASTGGARVEDPGNVTGSGEAQAETEWDALPETERQANHTVTGASTSAFLVPTTSPPQLTNGNGGTVYVGGNTSRSPTAAGDLPAPSLYRGPITSSPTGWDGFGASSGGLVESVFDLSPLSGRVIRFRLLTATADGDTSGRFGWVIDQLEVHANGEPGIDIIGLLDPGDGALLPQAADVSPSVVVHNRGRQPLDLRTDFVIDGGGPSATTVRLGVGADARATARLDGSLAVLADPDRDVHSIRVDIRPTAQAYSQGDGLVPPLASSTFHVGEGSRPGWEPTGMALHRVRTDRTTGAEVEEQATTLRRGDLARLHVTVRSLDTSPTWIDPAGDLVPALLDASGQPAGTPVVQTSADAAPDGRILLPPTRDTMGSLGDPRPERTLSWTWRAPDVAQVLQLVLRNASGDAVMDAGRIFVEAAPPPELDADFENPWSWNGSCERRTEWSGRHGVVLCSAGPGDAITSSIHALSPVLRARGDALRINAVHQGAGAEAVLLGHATAALDQRPTPGSVWQVLGTVRLDGSPGGWTRTSNGSVPIPTDWHGWLRLHLEPGGPFGLDSVQVEIVDEAGTALPINGATFDVHAAPETKTLRAVSRTGFLRLHVPLPCVEHPTTGACTGVYRWSGGDAFACLASPIDLTQAIRPTLRFRHWLDPHRSETARLEVRTAAPGAEPPPCGQGDGWTPIASYADATSGFDARATSASLWAHAGQHLFLRLHYQQGVDPDTRPSGHHGWFVEDLEVTSMPVLGHGGLLHRAAEDFQGMDTAGAVGRMTTYETGPAGWKPVEGAQHHHRGGSPLYPGATFVTEPFELDASLQPVLTLEHSYAGSWQPNFFARSKPLVDLEYQFLDDRGEWPPTWISGSPNDSQTLQPLAHDPHASLPDGRAAEALVDPETREPVGAPFSIIHADILGSEQGSAAYPRITSRFDLTPLQEGGEGKPIRMRLVVWGAGTHDWEIHSLRIASNLHYTDASVADAGFATDDKAALEELARQAGVGLPDDVDVFLSNDRALVRVNVSNPGIYPVDASVGLSGSDHAGTSLNIRSVSGGGGPIATVHGLQPGATQTLEFFADLRRAAPGNYTFRADVVLDDALDTNPHNDAITMTARVLPYRALQLDTARSRVLPYVTGPGDDRTVEVHVTNWGNVAEKRVALHAEVVRMTGLSTFEPTGLVLEEKAPLSLAKRGGAPEGPVTWSMQRALLPGQDLSEFLEPGHKYAVKVTVQPEAGSATQWWSDAGDDLLETRNPFQGMDASALWNLTRPDEPACGCLLVPFFAEDLLYRTTFGGKEVVSKLGSAFPASDDPVADGWTAQTLVDGTPVAAGQREDVPRWQRVAAGDPLLDGFSGEADGSAWTLPTYGGRSVVEHHLTSPPLPAHVVESTSSAILGMRYASGADQGEVAVQARTRHGDDWTDWAPVDETRGRRVAIVLAPDFPRVVPSGLTSEDDAYPRGQNGRPLPIPGHPAPPFYHPQDAEHSGTVHPFFDEDGNLRQECQGPDASSDCGTCSMNGICRWTPYPAAFSDDAHGNEWNRRWWAALNTTLEGLSTRLGAGNVGLFTTMPAPDGALGTTFLIPTASVGGTPAYTHRGETYPIHGLDELERRLGTYGAILLMGDNTTTTFASESPSLRGAAHGARDAANLANALALEHHRVLEDILAASPRAGVNVVGAIGPATATLAHTGLLQGIDALAAWASPTPLPDRVDRLRCTTNDRQMSLPDDWEETQPRPPCTRTITINGFPVSIPDERNRHNYDYISPYVAQSQAIQDLIRRGAGDAFIQTTGTRVSVAPLDGQSVVTAAADTDGGAWVAEVLQAVDDIYTGALPSGESAWRDLPPHLSSPVGGAFFQSGAQERFDGRVMQVRLVVRNGTDASGHGPVALDALSLFGSPREQDVGIRFLSPAEGTSHRPGAPGLATRVEVANRGLQPINQGIPLQVWAEYVESSAAPGCELPPASPFSVTTRPLAPGDSEILQVPLYGGTAPTPLPPPTCAVPPQQQTGRLQFHARLQVPGDWDEDPLDDLHAVRLHVREVVDLRLGEPVVRPTEAPVDGPEEVEVRISLWNHGTQTFQQALVQIRVHEARPVMCNSLQLPLGCDSRSLGVEGVEVHRAEAIVSVPRGGRAEAVFELELDPGVHRIQATATTRHTKDPSNAPPVPSAPAQTTRRIHLADDGSIVPDRGWAFDASGFQPIVSLDDGGLRVQAHAGGTSRPDTVVREGTGSHDGTFGPDPVTQDSQCQEDPPANPQACWLSHGWHVVPWCMTTGVPLSGSASECGDASSIIEWRRDATPSYEPGVGRTDGLPPGQPSGYDDFGPDTLIWQPHTESGRGVPAPLSLASFDRPHLNIVARVDATDHTAFTVEMQMARLRCNPPSQDGGPWNCAWVWDWGDSIAGPPDFMYDRFLENWFPLTIEGRTSLSPATVGHSPYRMTCGGAPGGGATPGGGGGGGTCTLFRNQGPTNPLGGPGTGIQAIWGGQTGQHEGSGGWEVLSIPLDALAQPEMAQYCQDASTWTDGHTSRPSRETEYLPQLAPSYDLCRYATTEDVPVARPVRFRILASSYGGDVGSSTMQIQSMALTDHRIGFQGAATVPATGLRENEPRIIALRVENRGVVDDEVEVAWRPLVGRSGISGDMDIALDLSGGFEDPARAVTLPLAAGESRLVWLRMEPHIQRADILPGSTLRLPFLVTAQSTRDPTAGSDIMLDASLETRPWPDLEIRNLLLGEDEKGGSFDAAEGVPLQPTLLLRNTGRAPIGGPDAPIHVLLRAVEINRTHGTEIPGTGQVFAETMFSNTIEPFSKAGRDTVVSDLPSWTPPRQGWYRITATVNRPDLVDITADPLPEKEMETLNDLSVEGRVGPVPFPDLRVADAWLSAVGGDGVCDRANRVQRAVDGHAYCMVAAVENRGEVGALGPEVLFFTGKAKHSSPPLDSFFPDDAFPPGTSIIVQSSTWLAQQRPDGEPWPMRVEASTRSATLDRDGRSHGFDVPVDRYALRLDGVPQEVAVSPAGQTHLQIMVFNRGSALMTPSLHILGSDPGVRATVTQQPTALLPGEGGPVTLSLVTSQAVGSGAVLTLSATTLEDNKVNVTLPLRLVGSAERPPRLMALPVHARPGNATMELAIDDPSTASDPTWHVVSPPDGPLGADWTFQASAGRSLVQVPIHVRPHAPPGSHSVTVQAWRATDGNVRTLHEVTIPLHVSESADLDASVGAGQTVGNGTPQMHLFLHNTGNVPLKIALDHATDFGSIHTRHGTLRLMPGEERTLPVEVVRGDSARSVGTTTIAWKGAADDGAAWSQRELSWHLDFPAAKLRIIETDLDDLDVRPGIVQVVHARIRNTGGDAIDAEALLVLDGIVHGRAVMHLQPHADQEAGIPFHAGDGGALHRIQLIARPLGTTTGPDDDAFYEAGDARIRDLTVGSGDAAGGFGIPGPAPITIGGALVAAALIMHRRRRI